MGSKHGIENCNATLSPQKILLTHKCHPTLSKYQNTDKQTLFTRLTTLTGNSYYRVSDISVHFYCVKALDAPEIRCNFAVL